MRLDNHRSLGDLAASIGHTGVQETVLSDANLLFCQHVKNGGNRSEIVVLLLVDQMYMDNLYHNAFRIFFSANIPNNAYIE